MDVDYYSLLTKAVAGKDAVARDQIYKDAFSLITRSHLTREAAAAHASRSKTPSGRSRMTSPTELAMECRRNQRGAVDGQELEAAGRRRLCCYCRHRPVGLVYGYIATKGPGIVAPA